MGSDLDIARGASLKPIDSIAEEMRLTPDLLGPYGRHVMKVGLDALEQLSTRPRAKYVVVSAITPTPLGEGRTTTAVGVGQAFRHIGEQAVVTIRQPSMGPTFGIEGGAAGGAPRGWRLPIREVRASVGAGFIYPLAGEMRTMPGLGTEPAATRIDSDDDGEIVGLS